MNRKWLIVVAFAVVLLYAAWYVWGPAHVPAGQAPLTSLTAANFGQFQNAFDASPDGPRIVLLFSPT